MLYQEPFIKVKIFSEVTDIVEGHCFSRQQQKIPVYCFVFTDVVLTCATRSLQFDHNSAARVKENKLTKKNSLTNIFPH